MMRVCKFVVACARMYKSAQGEHTKRRELVGSEENLGSARSFFYYPSSLVCNLAPRVVSNI